MEVDEVVEKSYPRAERERERKKKEIRINQNVCSYIRKKLPEIFLNSRRQNGNKS